MVFQDPILAGTTLVRDSIASENYVAGSAGWQITRDGNAEFNNVAARGSLESPNYAPGSTGWAVNTDGSAEFNNVAARGSMKSPNYAPGSTGWAVNTDGSAEFNAGTFRGAVVIHDASGNEVARIDSTGVTITDPASGSHVKLTHSSGAQVSMSPGTSGLINGIIDALVSTVYDTTTGPLGQPDYASSLTIAAPYASGKTGGSLRLSGDGQWSQAVHDAILTARSALVTGDLTVSGKINGRSLPLGLVAGFATRAGTVAQTPTNGAETAMTAWDPTRSSPNVTLTQGRAYRLKMYLRCWDTVTEDAEARVLLRDTIGSLMAPIWAQVSVPIPSTGSSVETGYYECHLLKTSATSQYQPGYTIFRQLGTGQLALYGDGAYFNTSLRLVVEDIGEAADLPPLDAIGV